MSSIDLGFIEPCEDPDLLLNIHFPSKVGGRPAWLDLENVPQPQDLSCPHCQDQCTFLLQLYASLEHDNAFHRSIYLFVCQNEACNRTNSAANFRVFRNQIPRKNAFYDYHPVPEGAEVAEAQHKFKLCAVCGCRGPFNCAQCKQVSYCSKAHQKIDWRAGHKEECGSGKGNRSRSSLVQLPEFEIVLEPEEKQEKAEKQHLEKELDELRKFEADGKATLQNIPDSELTRFAPSEADEDKFFSRFRRRVAGEPEQILRYDRSGEDPLWIAEANRVATESVPKCEQCQGDRVFEFQVMPQLLNSLKADSLDWGVLVVYTCKDSCGADGKYLPEFVYRQDVDSTVECTNVTEEDEEEEDEDQ